MAVGELARVVARVMREAWPLVVAEATFSILNVTDMFFVSRLGAVALAGVGAGGYVKWLLTTVLAMFYVGAMVVVSQAYGAKRLDLASRILGETIVVSLLVSLPLGIAGVLAAPLLTGFVSSNEATAETATLYLAVLLAGLPFNALIMVMDAAYRAVGANMGVLWGSIVTVVMNAVLDPVLIFWAGMGVAGAALASNIGNLAGAAYMLARGRESLGFPVALGLPGGQAYRVIRVGLPAMVERMLFAGGNYFYLGAVARCGTAALAAHTVGIRIESFAYMPSFALQTYASSEVGQLVGSEDYAGAEKRGWEIAKASAGFMVLAGLGLIASSPLAAIVFAPSWEIGKLVILYLVLAGLSEPALGLVMGISGAIRGAGETTVPTIINLAGLYLVRVAPSLALAGRFHGALCPLVTWLIMALDLYVRSIVFAYTYRRYFHKLAKKLV